MISLISYFSFVKFAVCYNLFVQAVPRDHLLLRSWSTVHSVSEIHNSGTELRSVDDNYVIETLLKQEQSLKRQTSPRDGDLQVGYI